MDVPKPDKTDPKTYRGLPVARVVYSMEGSRRAVIVLDVGNLLRVHIDRWDVSDWEITGQAYWQTADQRAIIVDDMDRALAIAAEQLA